MKISPKTLVKTIVQFFQRNLCNAFLSESPLSKNNFDIRTSYPGVFLPRATDGNLKDRLSEIEANSASPKVMVPGDLLTEAVDGDQDNTFSQRFEPRVTRNCASDGIPIMKRQTARRQRSFDWFFESYEPSISGDREVPKEDEEVGMIFHLELTC